MEKQFEVLKQLRETNIDKFCEEILARKFSKFEKVRREFSKFFGNQGLTRQLEKKADLKFANTLNNTKVGRNEL